MIVQPLKALNERNHNDRIIPLRRQRHEAKRMVDSIARKASNTINRARNLARGAQFLRKMGL